MSYRKEIKEYIVACRTEKKKGKERKEREKGEKGGKGQN
jgi:hypothetical protein